VLKPESIAEMIEIQANAKTKGSPSQGPQGQGSGLGYGVIVNKKGEKFLNHHGANPGWGASFYISVNQREGFVIASNSAQSVFTLNNSVCELWEEILDKGGDRK
jgi:CubicO group peptidase (beta-lactamase class C family)